ncbi:hypothetical protein [Nostoc sp. 106C]|nr:hypothetical protein [Nostoc sp. 106C]
MSVHFLLMAAFTTANRMFLLGLYLSDRLISENCDRRIENPRSA